ncbi:hypothetical protein ERO13_A11G034200v2 [Gossypium hirsutum]|uniref:Dof zinc finger protein n=1 Tax=Gossypium hirsutum TaxID=3635 RepID=A0A1U8N0M3_GOSHI|nr:dof zinc finger protein DOF5.4-like [Gossypium hirsutum]KAG4173054.1 hypothetical protein ERO13_A11G034200v2 [Gossypium hirsutum]
MQDIHLIEGGRLFNGGGDGGGGDRKLRAHHQALKCPRCDSSNTKFCYYNNYNLSQPRYFCKNCRRYWTKGGVLRNVPVGGGCRKAKRSKTKPSSETTVSATAVSALPHPEQQQQRQHQNSDQRKADSHSNTESSSLNAANCKVAVTNNNNNNSNSNNNSSSVGTTEAASAITSCSTFYGNPNNLGLEPGLLEQGSDGGIFAEIVSLTSLITSPNNETLSFDFGTVLNRAGQWQPQQMTMSMGGEEITKGLLDQTVQIEQSNLNIKLDSVFQPLDWEGNEDQGLFGLPSTVDQTYWSQNQWTDEDRPTLYPP